MANQNRFVRYIGDLNGRYGLIYHCGDNEGRFYLKEGYEGKIKGLVINPQTDILVFENAELDVQGRLVGLSREGVDSLIRQIEGIDSPTGNHVALDLQFFRVAENGLLHRRFPALIEKNKVRKI